MKVPWWGIFAERLLAYAGIEVLYGGVELVVMVVEVGGEGGEVGERDQEKEGQISNRKESKSPTLFAPKDTFAPLT